MDDTVSQFPPMDNVPYYLSDCEFVFNINDITLTENLIASLNNFRNICDCEQEPVAVFMHNIRDYGEQFLNTFSNPGVIIYPIGFFHWDQVNKLLTQNDGTASQCTGIRFYWGYQDLNLSGGNNDGYKIKLVAFGIDPDGGNVISSGSTGKIMLEQSWPPF